MTRRAPIIAVAATLLAFSLCAGASGTSPDTILGTLVDEGAGRTALFAAVALFTLVSEDLACIAAGLLAASGKMPATDAVAASLVGIFAGDMLIFYAGRTFGNAILPHRPMRWILKPETVRIMARQFSNKGAAIIFASRFTPGSRAATSFAAGALRQKPARFAVLFALAAAVWTPLLVYASILMGRSIMAAYGSYAKWALPVLIAAAILLFLLVRVVMPLFSWRGRRLLVCRYRRLTHWEYWPLWACSGPVFFYVLYLGFIKARKPTFFTIVNPGIKPDSGFIGESKDAIYKALSGAGEAILPWVKIPATLSLNRRLDALHDFMRGNGLTYPVVLKSDEGQRSLGVRVIHGESEAADYLLNAPGDTIVQQFCPGAEFGVFYYRLPGEEHGRIISVTEKHLTYVTGDGASTLERLILEDTRAVGMAPTFLRRFADRLDTVPAKGERIPLVEIGTHAQGALFSNGEAYNTPALLAEIERISKCFDGFYFGRYDLRAPSPEALVRGEGIRIIELNGVTGQCSHVYAPGNSIFYAWKTYFAQWRIAYAIAKRNLAQGIKPMPPVAFLRHWAAAAKRQTKVRESFGAAQNAAGVSTRSLGNCTTSDSAETARAD
jgi:membrane protein DedA with SNARE-associated domain